MFKRLLITSMVGFAAAALVACGSDDDSIARATSDGASGGDNAGEMSEQLL